MPHIITQSCCNDASCVEVCPVDCIHPRPDERGFASAEMLFIDPQACVDCGACIPVCPVDAITTSDQVDERNAVFVDINAVLAAGNSPTPVDRPSRLQVHEVGPLRVAVVGAGPAGLYAADHLLTETGVTAEVTVIDRLPSPWGLVRAGVAPDHFTTRNVTDVFRGTASRPGFAYRLGVEVGRDVTHEQLLEHHDAVIYAYGASGDQRLGIPGEDLPGSHPAVELVAWYNGHPDYADHTFDLSAERAVVVGNGNVALDVARILAMDPERLAGTDIADHALEALRASRVREVVVLGRRGVDHAAYTVPELHGLTQIGDVRLELDGPLTPSADLDAVATLKRRLLADGVAATRGHDSRAIVLRFLRSPLEVLGSDRVEGVRLVRNELVAGPDGVARAKPTGDVEDLECGLVIRAVGYRGKALEGLPYDDARGVVPNENGRVLGADGSPLPGTYVTGWIKRGPSGVIGTNRHCARETVDQLLADARAGLLAGPKSRDSAGFESILAGAAGPVVDREGWDRIDDAERSAGEASGRPRVRFVTVADLQAAAGV